ARWSGTSQLTQLPNVAKHHRKPSVPLEKGGGESQTLRRNQKKASVTYYTRLPLKTGPQRGANHDLIETYETIQVRTWNLNIQSSRQTQRDVGEKSADR